MASTTNYPANLQQIIDAPVEEVTGPRAAKTKAIATMAIPSDAAKAAKARTKRVAAEKKAHKKAHADFKRQLKATRKTLTQIWKEERKKDRLAKAAQKADKKARRKTKAPKAKAPKLTEEEKLMKRARKAYETEMRRRVKFMRTFSETILLALLFPDLRKGLASSLELAFEVAVGLLVRLFLSCNSLSASLSCLGSISWDSHSSDSLSLSCPRTSDLLNWSVNNLLKISWVISSRSHTV